MRADALAGELLDDLALIVVGGGAAHVDISVFAFDDDACVGAGPSIGRFEFLAASGNRFEEVHRRARGVSLGRQSANFVEDGGGLVVVVDELCVCGLAVVVIAETAADAKDSGGQVVMAENPSAHVELVRAVVAEFAASRGPDPVPVVVQLFAIEGQQGGRACP